ncbi:class I SAM-dependent methyltransferase [Pseudomonas sp. RAC1]|uniref:class I SAM-dependent methyltransferase n=1 Tax=Pseudomonas sp. RAC1 TaxID=3064900 RepID=UPI002728CA31|nr:class I SAM-dependent methyltransferase [Pseudomonas sp. RAC1]MDV9031723.1 class I SAM-dependent methyltransferase [Pseudomonas sp. RAC1]
MVSFKDVIAKNREAWNASADQHRKSATWSTLVEDVRRREFSCLDPTLTMTLEQIGVSKKEVVQLGCNNGREALSLFALGAAHVVGVDQSSEFLKQALELTTLSPYAPEFIEADIHNLPRTLDGQFDVALITIGVLNWMPDMDLFFSHVARLLKPGGVLVVYETHPFLEMLEPEAVDPWRIKNSYFQTEPLVDTGEIVYEGNGLENGYESFWHVHSLGDVLTGVARAGLNLNQFTEYPHSNREDVYDVYEGKGVQVPMCFILVAEMA